MLMRTQWAAILASIAMLAAVLLSLHANVTKLAEAWAFTTRTPQPAGATPGRGKGGPAGIGGDAIVTVQVVGAVLRSEGTACALRCNRMALPR